MYILNKKLFLAVLFVSCTLMGAIALPSGSSALTKNQEANCRDRWDEKQLTSANDENFKNSQCSKSGYCTPKTSREFPEGGSVTIVTRAICDGDSRDPDEVSGPDAGSTASKCADIETSIVECNNDGGNPVTGLLLQIVNFLAVGVGIAVVGGIIWGGMMYASSNGESSKIQQAKMIVVNAVVGLVLFIFMYAFINYLVPGGLFT